MRAILVAFLMISVLSAEDGGKEEIPIVEMKAY
jgi:hypothetical protein